MKRYRGLKKESCGDIWGYFQMEVVTCDLYAQGWLEVVVLRLVVHQPEFFEDLRNLIKYFKVHQRF